MPITRTIYIILLIALTVPAVAQQPSDPAQAALVQMVREAQQREANALVQAYQLRAQLTAEKKRADEAEAKLKATEKPADPK